MSVPLPTGRTAPQRSTSCRPIGRITALMTVMAVAAVMAPALAATAAPTPGEYFLQGRTTGMLTIQRDQRFDLRTVGVNDNTCGLQGRIKAGHAAIADSSCRISVTQDGLDLLVKADALAACRDYCGVQGVFEGRYSRPPAACSQQSVRKARQAFQQRYDASDFGAALRLLAPVATQCSDWIGARDKAWIANDLALTQFKLGDRQACLDTLAFLRRDAAMSDAQFAETYPPDHVRAFRSVVRAARTNLQLCGG